MRQLILSRLVFGLVIVSFPRAVQAQNPKQIVEQAIQATGGMAQLQQIKAVRFEIKGSFNELNDASMTGEIQTQLPGQYKLSHHVETEGHRLRSTEVLNGDKAWSRIDGDKLEALSGIHLTDMRQSAYVDYIASLVPLLSDKSFELSVLPPIKIQDKEALGIKVVSKGWQDVKLYFARDSKQLIKVENRRIYPDTGREVLWEEYRNEYRPVSPAVADLKLLQASGIANEGPALLAYLKQQTLTEDDQKHIRSLVTRLGDDAFAVREKARADLIATGAKAVPFLQEAVKSTDVEVAGMAKDCLLKIGKGPDPALLEAVTRLLAHHRPQGTAKALLDYLGASPNDSVNEEIRATVAAIAPGEIKPDPRKPASARLFLPGVQWPMKGVLHRDGKKIVDWEVVSVRFYSRLEDSVFAKP